jgi:hypothetical protein
LLRGLRYAKSWYIPLFLSKQVLVASILELGIIFSFDLVLFVLVGLELLYILLLLINRPYLSVFDNLGAFFCELIIFYSLILAAVNRFILISELDEVFMIFILQGFICLGVIQALVRIIIIYR